MAKVEKSIMKGKNEGESTELVPFDQGARKAALEAYGRTNYADNAAQAQGEIIETEVREKESLVGVPMVIFAIDERVGENLDKDGNYGTFFVLTCMPEDTGNMSVFTDGGLGIREQVSSLLAPTGSTGGVVASWYAKSKAEAINVRGGLKFDDYKNRDGLQSRTYRLCKAPPKFRANYNNASRAIA